MARFMPQQMNTFVANRVSTIQQTIKLKWHHVPTKENPADIASRGSLEELVTSDLWWHGPDFLKEPYNSTSSPIDISFEDVPEKRKNIPIFQIKIHEENYVLTQFALTTYMRLLKFTALALRWRNKNQRHSVPITAQEISNAQRIWVKIVQAEILGEDIHNVRHNTMCKTPAIKPLNPFIDEHRILRMNGRVTNDTIRQQSTAIILPDRHTLTTLMLKDAHEAVLHGGVQLTMRKLRDHFFIIHARSQVKTFKQNCLVCYRYQMRPLNQQMGRLPLFRTEQARPFAFVGCDFTGHFYFKASNLRNALSVKGYIALFICLTTKAIHLEKVEGLTTAEFLMAFDNFTARREFQWCFTQTMAQI